MTFGIGLFPTLHLMGDSCTDFHFEVIKVFDNLTLINEPAKPVRMLAI
ncbi:MAG: hypothetical protein K2J11_05355 [Oscillospiraceae bacterium]|nr:hypothetical protein [Oscillospiraceae bacterium]